MHPGDQHLLQNDKSGHPNPFLPQNPSMCRSTAQEIATIQAKLDRQLGPEYISDRPGAGGGKVQYLEAWKVINLANEIFGFNGWSSSIQNISVDYMEEDRESGRVNLGLSVIMRVTLKDGVYHEDIGYGSIDRAKSKAAAFEKCKKEGTTDALKRALRNFGNVLGNCLYDKTYLREVSKVKIPGPRFDPSQLHRRPEFAPVPKTVQFITTVAEKPAVAPVAPVVPESAKSVSEPAISQDQSDDDYFNDDDFEDRPLLVESPRLSEFDTNTLPPVAPPTFNLPPSHGDAIPPANAPQPPPSVAKSLPPNSVQASKFQPPQNQSLPETPVQLLHGSRDTTQSLPSNAPGQAPSDTPQIQQPPLPSNGFLRLSKDGGVASPYNHKAGNFSPLTNTASRGIDYGKSTPIARSKVHQPVPLGNNISAHNRMGQPPPQASALSHRMVGCPPSGPYSPRKPNLHMRANSASSVGGVKRNAQGQIISNNGEPNELQSDNIQLIPIAGTTGPDPKKLRG